MSNNKNNNNQDVPGSPTTTTTCSYMNTLEACAYLHISRWTLYRWTRLARIKAIRRGRISLYRKTELDKMVLLLERQVR
jgi:excisionase family DNA binding protein